MDEDGIDHQSGDEPQGVVDDVVKGCFGSLLIFGSISAGMVVLVIFAFKMF